MKVKIRFHDLIYFNFKESMMDMILIIYRVYKTSILHIIYTGFKI